MTIMKIKTLLSVTLCASSLFLAGCGGGDDKGVSTSDLKGKWVQICKNEAGASSNTVLEFTRTELTRSTYEYSDIGCNQNDIVRHMDIYYNYTLGDDVQTVDGKDATKISLTVTGYRVSAGTYGGSDIPQSGSVEKKIVYIDNRVLYTGEDQEPYRLDYDNYFEKK